MLSYFLHIPTANITTCYSLCTHKKQMSIDTQINGRQCTLWFIKIYTLHDVPQHSNICHFSHSGLVTAVQKLLTSAKT